MFATFEVNAGSTCSSAAPVMTLDAELLVANGIAGGDDQVVDAIGPVLDKIKHRLAEAT